MSTKSFLPGPVEVPRFVREAMDVPSCGHHSPEFRSVAKEVFAGLRELLGTDRPVAVVPCTGTGVMEGAVRGLVGKKILHASNGEFAKRWLTISVRNGIPAEMMFLTRGRAPQGPEIMRALENLEDVDTVAVTHSETSTGALAPLAGIGEELGKAGDTLVLVDAISSLAAVDIRPEELGVDLVIASSQKALGLPPGSSIVWMSERAYRRAKDREEPAGYFLDLTRWIEAAGEDRVCSTPAIDHFFGLRASLSAIREEGMAEREARHRRIAARVREWGSRFGVLAEEGFESPTVTVLRKPDGFDFAAFSDALRDKGYVIADGYGRLKDRTFRIGHMGWVTDEDVEGLIAAMDACLNDGTRPA